MLSILPLKICYHAIFYAMLIACIVLQPVEQMSQLPLHSSAHRQSTAELDIQLVAKGSVVG